MRMKLLTKAAIIFLAFVMMSAAEAGIPVWTFTPLTPTTFPVSDTGVATVQYIVQNQSHKAKRLVLLPMPGIQQTAPCNLNPKGQAGDTCTLSLLITGSALPAEGITGGPNLCQANPNGSPDPNQCYQPSSANILRITKGGALPSNATITVTPNTLIIAENSTSTVTVTNPLSSPVAANNVTAVIPPGSSISIQGNTCGASLAVNTSCTITFSSNMAEGPTSIAIKGSNTNTANVIVTVTPVIISVNPSQLLFAVNSTGDVTVTNNAGSPGPAENIVATIPGGSNSSVQSSTCGASLGIGASCTITFTSNVQEGPTTIAIAGDNTNSVNVDVTVTSQPQISITGPLQQNRVVPVSGGSLSLQITNDGGSAVNAEAITVSGNPDCPNLSVIGSTCGSVPAGGNCALDLASSTPYEPCLITVSGSNTANSPTTLIAFSHLGGLVFQESAGSGKVVTGPLTPPEPKWQNFSEFVAVATSTAFGTGAANTTAIINTLTTGCTSASDCAAFLCRNLNGVPTPDWYLPARDELSVVRSVLCTNAALPCTFGDFLNAAYWSSSQFDTTNAWVVNLVTGGSGTSSSGTPRPVRCVRDFSP